MIGSALLAMSVRRPQSWLGCAAALSLPGATVAFHNAAGPWIAPASSLYLHTILLALASFVGLSAYQAVAFATVRLPPARRLRATACVIGASVAAVSFCGWAGTWMANGSTATMGGPLPWAWSTVVLATLTTALAARARSPGRCLLAVVAVLWWIPAVLPPSLLLAVPRALRLLVSEGPEIATPGEPRAWLADTALVAGLLLLAWAPRRGTPRVHEVRHPG